MASGRLNRTKKDRFKTMNRKLYIATLLIVFSFLSDSVSADEKHFLTVGELINNGYVRLTGLQLATLMEKHVIEVVDIETDAVSISQRGKTEAGMERKFKEVKSDKSLYFLDSRLLARAPALEGKIDRKIVGDELISTDGIRTYHYSVYEKQGQLFAVRDIDHGNVYYRVNLK